ncbi:MAG: hypothetical protein MR051_04320 [Lentisphaeria bacterium]|nr:hypothetical protein [Lentisphaeria bacterium]
MGKKLFWLLPALLLGAGCMQVDYVGRKFAPSQQVLVYDADRPPPADRYTIIGRFTVTTKPKVHPYEVEYEIRNRAAEYGGDAIQLVKSFERFHGLYNTDAEEFGTPAPTEKEPPEREKKLFGAPKPLAGNAPMTKRREYHYLLLKDAETVKRELLP